MYKKIDKIVKTIATMGDDAKRVIMDAFHDDTVLPKWEINRREDEPFIATEFEMPGFEKSEITLTVVNTEVRVNGKNAKRTTTVQTAIPSKISTDEILKWDAELKNGILYVKGYLQKASTNDVKVDIH